MHPFSAAPGSLGGTRPSAPCGEHTLEMTLVQHPRMFSLVGADPSSHRRAWNPSSLLGRHPPTCASQMPVKHRQAHKLGDAVVASTSLGALSPSP